MEDISCASCERVLRGEQGRMNDKAGAGPGRRLDKTTALLLVLLSQVAVRLTNVNVF